MNLTEMSFRRCDGHGCGHWHAKRGDKLHQGVDLACIPGTCVASPVKGFVTKLGIVYADDHHWQYVQISSGGYDFRIFYVEPMVEVGRVVGIGTLIGRHQRLNSRYMGITEHVHFEIKNDKGEYIDPTPALMMAGGL